MENRFKRLRYEDDLCLHKKYTMDELAAKMPISKATISHLEASDDYDAKTSIMKEYKKMFPEVSYDYLLGATNTMHKQYSQFEEDLPFSNDFYDNLNKLLQKSNESTKIEYMLIALLSNPDSLAELLKTLFSSYEELYRYTHDEFYKEMYTSMDENVLFEARQYILSKAITEYLTSTVMPKLNSIFDKNYVDFKKDADQFLSSLSEETLPNW